MPAFQSKLILRLGIRVPHHRNQTKERTKPETAIPNQGEEGGRESQGYLPSQPWNDPKDFSLLECYTPSCMQESEKREILQLLDTGRDALREALAGIDEHLAVLKPKPNCWSILECVEHLGVSEEFLLSREPGLRCPIAHMRIELERL